jgi:hypothetical protein
MSIGQKNMVNTEFQHIAWEKIHKDELDKQTRFMEIEERIRKEDEEREAKKQKLRL